VEQSGLLDIARTASLRVVKELFPQESDLFEDMWSVLLPTFTKWLGLRVSARHFKVATIPAVDGLTFDKALNWAMAIGMSVTTATLLELLESEKLPPEQAVRATARKYASEFGATETLQEALEQTVSRFSLELYARLRTKSLGIDYEQTREAIGAALTESSPPMTYVVLTNNQPPRALDLRGLVEFKKQNTPADFFMWIDESQGEVFLEGKPLDLGPRLTRVLRYLVELRKQCVRHSQLRSACGRKTDYETDDDKTSRRWVISLREAGEGGLQDLIKTKPGGFAYEGPASFCIIKSVAGGQ